MAWVRYDDGFPTNPKVTAVIVDNPAALALHVLGNTWTNAQRRPGFIPAHQPAALVCDRSLGAEWAAVLVRHGLWHERSNPCGKCAKEYADLPEGVDGYLVHDAQDYRAPARDRAVAGTPVDLSEKRRAAGRKGGQTTAARRKSDEAKQEQVNQATADLLQEKSSNDGTAALFGRPGEGGQADPSGDDARPPVKTPKQRQANSVSKSSNLLLAGVSPEPVNTSTSNEVEAQQPEPTPMQRAFGIARAWITYRAEQKTPVVGKGRTDPLHILKNLIEPFAEKGYTDGEIKQALVDIGESIPSTGQLDRALTRLRQRAPNIPINSGYRSQRELPESNAPKRIADEDRCPEHRAFKKDRCGPCRANRLAAGVKA